MSENKETNFNNFCLSKRCPAYVEWSFGNGDCTSCKLFGQSYNIDEYPNNCLFLSEIKKFEKENISEPNPQTP